MRNYILLMLLPAITSAQATVPLSWPINPRIMGMGQAYVAVADDPQAAHRNPAGIKTLTQIGYDFAYDAATDVIPNHWSTAIANPGTESGAAFGMSLWTQGISEGGDATYYVPTSGTCVGITSTTHLGMVLRFPYYHSRQDSIKSRWEVLADLSALQSFGGLRFGATMERAFGGAKDMVPRRIHWGAAFSSAGITMAYEWIGDETENKLDFMRTSSHWGAEAVIGKYSALRAGYIFADTHRLTFGGAIGLMKAGWRLEFGWDVPTADAGITQWSIGLGYRI